MGKNKIRPNFSSKLNDFIEAKQVPKMPNLSKCDLEKAKLATLIEATRLSLYLLYTHFLQYLKCILTILHYNYIFYFIIDMTTAYNIIKASTTEERQKQRERSI